MTTEHESPTGLGGINFPEPQPPRIRINWKQLANGRWQPEMTLEGTGLGEYPQERMDADMAAMLRESDKLKAELVKR